MFNLNVSRMGRVGIITLTQRIRALFANSEPGLWYDPSDFSTLFQDSAGTTPVTAVDQPVGKILDMSGRGNHATQPTAINRPVIQQDAGGKYYLAFNGTNSWMSTGNINFTATDKMTTVAGVRKLSNAAAGILSEFTTISTNPGSFYLAAPTVNGSANIGAGAGGTTRQAVNAAAAISTNMVFTMTDDIAASTLSIRIDSVQVAQNLNAQGAGTFANAALYIGARAGDSLFFKGNLYSLIVRGALSSNAQISSAETYANSKTGAY